MKENILNIEVKKLQTILITRLTANDNNQYN